MFFVGKVGICVYIWGYFWGWSGECIFLCIFWGFMQDLYKSEKTREKRRKQEYLRDKRRYLKINRYFLEKIILYFRTVSFWYHNDIILISHYYKRYSASFCATWWRQTPTRSAPAPAEDERRSGTTSAPPTFSALTAPPSAPQGRHTTPTSPDITPEAPHPPTVSALFAADIVTSHERRSHSALIQPHPRLDISENVKKRNDRRPHKPPIYSTFHALTGTEAAAIQAAQISLMRRINRRSTEPQRNGATFTFALNPGRAVALLG